MLFGWSHHCPNASTSETRDALHIEACGGFKSHRGGAQMVSSCQSGPVANQQAQARHAPTPWRPLAAVESWLETNPKWPKWHGFAASSRACHGAMARSLGLRGTAWQRTGLMSAMTSAVRRAWGASMRISMLPRPSRCSGLKRP